MKEILVRVNQNLLFLVLTCIILYFGKPVLVPIMLGTLLAMLMAPVCRKLDEKGASRAFSSAVCIIILLLSLCVIAWIISSQIASFMEDINQIQAKAKELLHQVQSFIEAKVKIPREEQKDIAKEQVQNGGAAQGIAGSIFSGLTSTLTTIVLMLVYTFLFLYSKEKFEAFFVRIYHEEDTEKVKTIVGKISMVGQKYLTGRVMSILILWTLYSIALLIIGLKNAIILGGIAALLTIVPYVGTALGGFFPFMVALTTGESPNSPFMVIIAIVVIQTIDNYFIEPNVVGGEVNLSALASIFSIIIGAAVWGVAGMILFIPMVAILKIIFDHVESLKPIGYIIGDSNGNGDGNNLFTKVKEKLFGKQEDNESKSAG
jgi:predicted PurR-regulated permease PerM